MVDELNLIKDAIGYLNEMIDFRDDLVNSRAIKYSTTMCRTINRIKQFLERDPNNFVVLTKFLSQSDFHQDIKETMITAICGNRKIEEFSDYQRLLICRVIYGEEVRIKY